MSTATPATQALDKAGIAFGLASYEYDAKAHNIGLYAAQAMGVDPVLVFKTLMVEIDGKPAYAILPAPAEVNMKKLAAALAGKSAHMMAPAAAERLTGYKIGGISPLGQRRRVPGALDETAGLHGEIFINGGRRGLQIRIRPADLIAALACVSADLRR